MHGFTGTPANVRVVSEALAGAGYTVYTPLLRGHGTSLREMDACTEQDWIEDAYAAYDYLVDAGCTRIVLIGLSMGGLLCAIVAQSKSCAGLILLSAPLRLRSYLINAKRMGSVVPFLVSEGEPPKYQIDSLRQGYRGVPLKKLRDLERMSVRARGGLYKIQCPVLVLQSAKDNRVDMRSVSIAKNGIGSGNVQVEFLAESPHVSTIGPEKELVAARCLSFVQQVAAK